MLKLVFLSMCLLPLADAFLLAQSAEPLAGNLVVSESPASGSAFLIHKRVDEVRVVFSVTDKHGRPMAGLRAEDIVVEDNGRIILDLASFCEGSGMPLRLTFLVDTSSSMAGSFRRASAAVQRWQSRLSDSGMTATDWTSFASNKTFSGAALLGNRRPEGATAMLDALGAEILRSISVHEPRERRVILLLSDGEDNLSSESLLGVIAEAQRSNTAIYTVAAHSAKLQFPGDRVLRTFPKQQVADTFCCRTIRIPIPCSCRCSPTCAAHMRSAFVSRQLPGSKVLMSWSSTCATAAECWCSPARAMSSKR